MSVFGDLLAHLRRNLQRWRFLDQLLMPALDGAFALAERDDVAVLVGQHLELDVPRPLDELLHIEIAVAEGVRRFGMCGLEERGQLLRGAHDAHAAPAAACRSFEDDRIADGLRPVESFVFGLDDALRAGQNRHLGALHRLRAFSFSPIRRVTSGGGPMNLMFDARQTSAKLAFSLRKP